MNEELRRCPFCKSESVRLQYRIARHLSCVECPSCHARGPAVMSAEEAVKYWQHVSGAVEKLEAAL